MAVTSPLGVLLKQVPIFADLDANALDELATHCRRKKYPAQDTLFHEGDPGLTLYIILQGRVKIQVTSTDGDTIHIALRGPGDHFGEMALIDDKPRMADAITAEACELLILSRAAFTHCVNASPRIALSVMAALAERLREAALLMQKHKQLDVLGRVSAALLELAQGDSAEGLVGRRLVAPITRQELADRVGAKRESVSRVLSLLQKSSAIQLEGRQIVVMDSIRLRRNCRID